MNVVELLERLRAEGIELAWWDTAGAVWQGGAPPADAEPWVAELGPQLQFAVRGAGTGHRWGACAVCGEAQLAPNDKQAKRTCHITPRCQGKVGRWVDLPVARDGWKVVKSLRKLAVAQAQAQTAATAAPRGLLGLRSHRGGSR